MSRAAERELATLGEARHALGLGIKRKRESSNAIQLAESRVVEMMEQVVASDPLPTCTLGRLPRF